MQPTLCSRCKKNVAVVFISRMNEKNEMVNEGPVSYTHLTLPTT